MTVEKTTGMQPRDKWIPWYFVAFFAVVFAVNGVYVYMAIHTMPGVVEEHHYEKGLKYNQRIAEVDKQAKLGWKGDVQFKLDVAAPQSGTLQVVFTDANGEALEKADVNVLLTRPTGQGQNQRVVLKELAPGDYQAAVTLPLLGQWEASVAVVRGDDRFELNKRLVIK